MTQTRSMKECPQCGCFYTTVVCGCNTTPIKIKATNPPLDADELAQALEYAMLSDSESAEIMGEEYCEECGHTHSGPCTTPPLRPIKTCKECKMPSGEYWNGLCSICHIKKLTAILEKAGLM